MAAVNKAHRLGAGVVVVTEGAADRRGHRPRSRFSHPAHRHAQVFRLDDHHHAAWLQRVRQGVGYLAGHPFLHLRAPRVHIDQPGQLGQPGDLALGVRDVTDVRDADEREQVMFARPVHLDVANEDHLVMVRVENGGEHVPRGLPKPGELLRVSSRDPGRGVAQAIALRVLADRDQDLPDRALDARQVELAGLAAGRAPDGRRARPFRADPASPPAAEAPSVMRVGGLALTGLVVVAARRSRASGAEAERLAVGGQRHAAVAGAAVSGRQGEFLGREHRRAVRGQALAVARVRTADRPLLHRREDLQDLGPGHGLLVEQPEHQRVEHVAVLDEDFPGLVVRGLDQAADLLVDRGGDLLGVVPVVRHVPAQERLAVAVTELARAQPLAHPVLGDHAARDLGGLLDVVGGTGGRLVEDELLGGAPAQEHGQLVEHLGPGDEELVLGRQRAGVTQRPAARDDRHLVHRIGVRHRVADQRVAALVVGDDLPLLLRQQHALALRTRHDPVDGLFQRLHRDLLAIVPRGQQRALVDHVGQVGAGEPGRAPGDDVEVGIGRDGLAPGVHPQDRLTARQVRLGHHDLPVETAGPQQRRVEDVGPVGGRDDDDAALGVEAVQLDQHLVQRLLALVVTAAQAGAAVPPHGVDLVDEHDRRGVRLGLLEQVADPGRADTDEHLNEVRAGNRVERNACLTGHRPGEQGLAGARRAVEQHALGDLGPDGLELRRSLQEILDLLQFLDGLVHAGHVGERRLRGVLGDQLGLGLAEVHHPGAAALHLGQHEEEQEEDHQVDEGGRDQVEERVALRDADVVPLRQVALH